jgi:hypothetical protein
VHATFADRLPGGAALALCFLAYQLLVLLMGYGAALLLLPRSARRDSLALAPPIGFCVLVACAWHLMYLGPRGTDHAWRWVVGIGIALTAAGCVVRRRELRQTLDRDVLCLFACAAASVLIYAYPTLREAHLTAAGQNNDLSSYSAVERQLQVLPGDTPKGPDDQLGLVHFGRTTVAGAYLATATLSSALRVPTYQLQTASLAAYAFWGALLAGLFALRVLGFRRGGAMLVALLAGTARVTLYAAWCAFKASLAGTALFLALLVIAVPAFAGPPSERPIARAPLMALLGAGLMLTYPHQVPIVWGLLGALALAHAFVQRRWGALRDGAVLLGAGLWGAAALSPERVGTMVAYFLEIKTSHAGYEMGALNPPSLLGLSGDGPDWSLPFGWPGQVAASLAVAALALWGLRRTWGLDRPAAITAAALLGILGLGYVALLLTEQPMEPAGYKPFKLVSFFYPAGLACLLLAFRELRPTLGNWADRLKVAGAAGLAASVALLSAASARERRPLMPVALPEYADLQRLETDPRIESINIVTPDFWEAMWQTAFLLRKPLSLKHRTYYDPSPRLAGAWDLERVPAPDDVLLQAPAESGAIVPVNARYQLRRHGFAPSVQFGGGWSFAEPRHRWTTARRPSLRLEADEGRTLALELRYQHLAPGTTFDVLLDGRPLGRCPEPNACSLGPFELPAGRHTLAFDSSAEPRSPGPGDPRTLGTSFWLIQLAPP